jgi:serine/threonine-protein kinase
MAPEQVLGAREVGDRADVYAVGVILFRLLTGRQPFEAESPREVMMSRLLDDAPGVRAVQPLVPEPLARLVDRCLARSPDDRPPAAELARELARWADAAGAPPLDNGTRVMREAAPTLPAGSGDDLSTY